MKSGTKLVFKSALCLSVLATLGACKNAPSDDETKKFVNTLVGECKYFTVTSFEKINGMESGPNLHDVAFRYSVKATPLPGAEKLVADAQSISNEIDSMLVQAAAEKDRQIDLSKEYDVKIKAAKEAGDNALEDAINKEQRAFIREHTQPAVAVWKDLERQKEKHLQKVSEPLQAELSKVCPTTNGFFYANFYKDSDVSDYAKELTQTFEGQVTLVKTDNGWQPSR